MGDCPSTAHTRRTLLHLGNQFLVEHAPCLLVQGAVDGHDITLFQHLFQSIAPPAANLLLDLRLQRLVVKVQQLLAIKGLQSPQNTLSDPSDSDGSDDLVLQVVLVLRDGSDVPLAAFDLLVGGNEVADQREDGHDDVFGDGNDVGAGDFGDGDTAIGLVGGIEVDVVGTDPGGDGELELFGFGKTLSGEVAGMEAVGLRDSSQPNGLTGNCATRLSSPSFRARRVGGYSVTGSLTEW